MTHQANTPSPSDLACVDGIASSTPLEKIDLSLYLPFGQWSRFEKSSIEEHLSGPEALANLIDAHLFGKSIVEQMEADESEDLAKG